MQPERLYALCTKWVDLMWPVATQIRKLPRGDSINWRLLVADFSTSGVKGTMLKEWSYLVTFDMLSPRYDRPARLTTFRGWAVDAGLRDVEAEPTGHGVVLRARTSS
jgi:hypothetical protein